jgi:hypothetical protein
MYLKSFLINVKRKMYVGIPVKYNAGIPDEYENNITMYTYFQ